MDGFQEDLKNHYEQGWLDREDSIIKLLEKEAEITGYVEIELNKLKALIKGDSNGN